MSILSASSFSDHYPDALIIVARVADLVGMSDHRARFRKQAEECRQQAESAISQLDRGVAAGWMTPSNDPRPRIAPGDLFLSIRCWRPHTELQVGTPEAFPRLGWQAIAIR